MGLPGTKWDGTDPSDPKGYYAYFGLKPSASPDEIQRAYERVLAECADVPFVINEAKIAYDVLSNPATRALYGLRAPHAGPMKPSQPPAESRPSGTSAGNFVSTGPAKGGSSPQPYRLAGMPIGISHPPQHRPPQAGGCLVLLFPLLFGAICMMF
jgi:curved DNA-binding protein CbpA